MDQKLLLAKSITLLYRESQLKDKVENSADLVRTVMDSVRLSDVGINNIEKDIVVSLKNTIFEMCNNPLDHEYDLKDLLQRIKINTFNDERLYEAIKQGLEDELPESSLKRNISNTKKAINIHFKEQQAYDVINKAATTFRFKRESIKDITQFITDIIGQLEPLQVKTTSKDAAIIGEIDIGNEESLRGVFANVAAMNSGVRVYKTGHPEINRMLQGGFRPGETWVYNALQHKYKTGWSLALFAQTALFNKPLTTDPNKKPLLLRISFEDDLVNNLQFIYQYLKYSETGVQVFVKDTPIDEMTSYVKEKLQANGFHIKMRRVDPSQWTYKNICNAIIELEAQGYVIEVLDLDYLFKVPTTGCIATTPGSDILDLFSRMRNFCAGKGILLRTPHQLSTEAKNLLRTGIPEEQFVKELAGKGYFEGTKGLDRIYDGGMLLHLFKHNKETYFTCQLDKHRFPTVVDEDERYYIWKFPKHMPIPHSTNGEDTACRRLKDFGNEPTSDEIFNY